jgi:rod shape determining protein RodA
MGLVMLQPDLGTALVFCAILLAALFWAGTPLFVLFLLVSPALGLLLSQRRPSYYQIAGR